MIRFAQAVLLTLSGCSFVLDFDGADDGTADGGGSVDAGSDDGGAEDGPACIGTMAVIATPADPTVILLVDRSGSMATLFGGPTRWQAVHDALMDPTTGFVTLSDHRVRYGLAAFTSNGGTAGGTCPILDTVTPAANNRDGIESIYGPLLPLSDSPTGEAIDAVSLSLPAGTGQKLILLLTDGDPDTCADPENQTHALEAIEAAGRALAAGAETRLIAIGPEPTEMFCEGLANAGGGTPFARALDPAGLQDALNVALVGLDTCGFDLIPSVNLATAGDAMITLDETTLVFGADWQLESETKLRLLGSACQLFLEDVPHVLDAQFPCD